MCVHDQGLWVEPSGRHALWGGLITSTEQQVWGLSLQRGQTVHLPQQVTESWARPARLWAPQTLNLVYHEQKAILVYFNCEPLVCSKSSLYTSDSLDGDLEVLTTAPHASVWNPEAELWRLTLGQALAGLSCQRDQAPWNVH